MKDRVAEVLGRVKAAALRVGRDPGEVSVTAITKSVSPDRVMAYVQSARELGIRPIIGESYLKEFVDKIEFCEGVFEKRFVGPLRASQIPKVWRLFDVIETLGDMEAIEACAGQMAKGGPVPRLLMQVNISKDPRKSGFYPESVCEALVFAKKKGVQIAGFMTITEQYQGGTDEVRADYRALAALARNLRQREEFLSSPFESSRYELSMGMSSDFEVAVEEGATHIRLGSILFR